VLPCYDSAGTTLGYGVAGGLKYTWVGGGLTYALNPNTYWVDTAGNITTANTNSPFTRRSFGHAFWNGKPTTYGGYNDTTSTFYNDAWQFSNGMTNATRIANGCDPGSLFGCVSVVFNGKFVVIGGQWSGGFTSAIWSTSSATLAPGTWTSHTAYPGGACQAIWAATVIENGVETLIAGGGRGSVNKPIKGVWKTTDLTNWSSIGSSDFWGWE
jgi:hypothetical protein